MMTSFDLIVVFLAVTVILIVLKAIRSRYWHEFVVQEGFVG